MFVDVVEFTKVSEKLSPKKLVHTLDHYFKAFDEIIERYGLEKIKTIGDAYVAVCSMPRNSTSKTQDLVEAALEMTAFCDQTSSDDNLIEPLQIRVGIHTGSVIAGIVGNKKFQYDIWGDAVNTAALMQECGEPNKINISANTYSIIESAYACSHRGKRKVKNKADMDMYFVEGKQ